MNKLVYPIRVRIEELADNQLGLAFTCQSEDGKTYSLGCPIGANDTFNTLENRISTIKRAFEARDQILQTEAI